MGTNQRAQILMSETEIADFVTSSRTGTLATIGPDGQPHLTAMWYGVVDGEIWLETKAKSQKAVNLKRDPRVSFLLEDGQTYDTLRGVSFEGVAEIVDDPDAPSGLFTHWIIWNTSPQTSTMAEGSTPKGVEGMNDFGKSRYGGPCPPSGTHRYFFKIFALDKELDLPAGSKRAQLDAAMKSHVIAQGELMGRYSRQK